MKEHEAFALRRAQRQFAELMDISEKQDLLLATNPRPFLERAYSEICHWRMVVQDARAALMGLDTMQDPDQLRTTQSVDHQRIKAALAILNRERR